MAGLTVQNKEGGAIVSASSIPRTRATARLLTIGQHTYGWPTAEQLPLPYTAA